MTCIEKKKTYKDKSSGRAEQRKSSTELKKSERELERRGTPSTINNTPSQYNNQFAEMMNKGCLEMQHQNKYQQQIQSIQFKIIHYQNENKSIREDIKMLDNDELEEKNELKSDLKKKQRTIE